MAVIYDVPACRTGLPLCARTVVLLGELVMLPVTAGDLAAGLDQADDGDRETRPGWVLLRPSISALAWRLSAGVHRR